MKFNIFNLIQPIIAIIRGAMTDIAPHKPRLQTIFSQASSPHTNFIPGTPEPRQNIKRAAIFLTRWERCSELTDVITSKERNAHQHAKTDNGFLTTMRSYTINAQEYPEGERWYQTCEIDYDISNMVRIPGQKKWNRQNVAGSLINANQN